MGEDAVVQELVKLLDNVFGGTLGSDAFVRGSMIDWSQEQYIEGGYGSPLVVHNMRLLLTTRLLKYEAPLACCQAVRICMWTEA